MRMTAKRRRVLAEIKVLAEKLNIEVVWADLELATYSTLCLIRIDFELALPKEEGNA